MKFLALSQILFIFLTTCWLFLQKLKLSGQVKISAHTPRTHQHKQIFKCFLWWLPCSGNAGVYCWGCDSLFSSMQLDHVQGCVWHQWSLIQVQSSALSASMLPHRWMKWSPERHINRNYLPGGCSIIESSRLELLPPSHAHNFHVGSWTCSTPGLLLRCRSGSKSW